MVEEPGDNSNSAFYNDDWLVISLVRLWNFYDFDIYTSHNVRIYKMDMGDVSNGRSKSPSGLIIIIKKNNYKKK